MPRLFHSADVFIAALDPVEKGIEVEFLEDREPTECPEPTRFDYMFPKLQLDESNRVPTLPQTPELLCQLGLKMRDPAPLDPEFDSPIPSAYTYFGQFIAHDISLDPITKKEPLNTSHQPVSPATIKGLKNARSGFLDLDSVYGPGLDETTCFVVPRKDKELAVAHAYTSPVDGTDLPRGERFPFEAKIGDRRNDENLITSQLHLAFLRAHNMLVREGVTFEQAREFLRRRYRYLVTHDFLPKIVSAEDIQFVRNLPEKLYSPAENDFWMPIEFAGAAFRFAHAMIRSQYQFNQHRPPVKLYQLFMPSVLGKYYQILDDWIIDWNHFVEGGANKARAFLPRLVEPLSELLDNPANARFSLAVRDLLRGYRLGLPTGQAVAKEVGVKPLTPSQIEEAALDDAQRKILREGGFLERTPLWYYILAESRLEHGGKLLGPVCGRIIAAVLLELEARSISDNEDDWDSVFGSKAGFNLSQFILQTLP